MRLQQRAFAAILTAFIGTTSASGQSVTEVREVGYGVKVWVPVGWVLSTSSELQEVRNASVARMRASGDPRAKELADQSINNPPIFAATTEAIPGARIGMTGTRNPDFSRNMFRAVSMDVLAEMRDATCGAMAQQAADRGGTSECGTPEVRTVAGRSAVFITQRLAIPSLAMNNRRLNVVIPARGMTYSLYISLPHDRFDNGIVQKILGSIVVPE